MPDDDRWSFNEGTHLALYGSLGAHIEGTSTIFRVWAPSATRVQVIGDFTDWLDGIDLHPDPSGVWHGAIDGVGKGAVYKYRIGGANGGEPFDKADPFATMAEEPPRTGSIVWDREYSWGDKKWMGYRRERNALDAPISIYEIHLGSWRYEPG